MYKKIAIGIVFVLLFVGLSGCNEISNPFRSNKDKLIGTWERTDGRIINFNDDYNFNVEGSLSGNWDITDTTIILYSSGSSQSYSYEFEDNNNLILTRVSNGEIKKYRRI